MEGQVHCIILRKDVQELTGILETALTHIFPALAPPHWEEVRNCIGRLKTWEAHISERTLAVESLLAVQAEGLEVARNLNLR